MNERRQGSDVSASLVRVWSLRGALVPRERGVLIRLEPEQQLRRGEDARATPWCCCCCSVVVDPKTFGIKTLPGFLIFISQFVHREESHSCDCLNRTRSHIVTFRKSVSSKT